MDGLSKPEGTVMRGLKGLAAVCFILWCGNVNAAIHQVNQLTDTSDAMPGDGLCDDNLAIAGLTCSLRAAIEEANAAAGADQIEFTSIPVDGQGQAQINLSTPLPTITDELIINGDTAPGWDSGTGIPVVVVNGSAIPPPMAGQQYGLLNFGAGAESSRAVALALGNSASHGIRITTASGVWIHSCHIGMRGETAMPIVGRGVSVTGNSHAIGRRLILLANLPNFIGNTGGAGIWLDGDNNSASSNRLGYTPAGQAAPIASTAIVLLGNGNRTRYSMVTSQPGYIGHAQRGIEVLGDGNVVDDYVIGAYVTPAGQTVLQGAVTLQGVFVAGTNSEIGGVHGNTLVEAGDSAIYVNQDSDTTLIRSNYIGVDPARENPSAMSTIAIEIEGNAQTSLIQQNVIGSMTLSSILVWVKGDDTWIWDNYIGVLPDGTAIASGDAGTARAISLNLGSVTQIGLGTDGNFAGNVIANTDTGISISTSNVLIGANYFGLLPDGTLLPSGSDNGSRAISLTNTASAVEVGGGTSGVVPAAANYFRWQGPVAQVITVSELLPGLTVRNNHFYDLPNMRWIFLPGTDPADPGDADTGPNLGMNIPHFTVPPTLLIDAIPATIQVAVDSDTALSAATYPLTVDVYYASLFDASRRLDYLDSIELLAPNTPVSVAIGGLPTNNGWLYIQTTDSAGLSSEISAAAPFGDALFYDGFESP